MGNITLPDDSDVPFPRRLFSALADFATSRGADLEIWKGLQGRYLGGGSFLDIRVMDEEELVSFRWAVMALLRELEGVDEYAGFDASGVIESLRKISGALNN